MLNALSYHITKGKSLPLLISKSSEAVWLASRFAALAICSDAGLACCFCSCLFIKRCLGSITVVANKTARRMTFLVLSHYLASCMSATFPMSLCNPTNILIEFFVGDIQKSFAEKYDIVLPPPQRRYFNAKLIQPLIQVHSEMPRFYQVFQTLVSATTTRTSTSISLLLPKRRIRRS